MTGRLADRVVVVTGAGGISSAGATRFAAEGAAVFVVSRDAEECRTLAGEVAAAGGAADWVPADLRDEAATVAAMERCRARFGRIDGLFAVAGGSGRRFGDGPLHDIPLGGWEETFAANATPMFVSAREAVRAMLERGEGGSLVIVTSVLADHPAPKFFATHAYAAAKGAARSFVRAVAAMYATSGIRVNAVAPGLIATPMSARAARDPATAAYARARQPLAGDLLPPEAVADAALFLLSDEARYITGQVLTVDGGWSITDAAAGVDGGENV